MTIRVARVGATESTLSHILGHKAIAGTIEVSGIYDRFDRLPEIRAALAAWSVTSRPCWPARRSAAKSFPSIVPQLYRETIESEGGSPPARTSEARGHCRMAPRVVTKCSGSDS
jgi:hypothetical protein